MKTPCLLGLVLAALVLMTSLFSSCQSEPGSDTIEHAIAVNLIAGSADIPINYNYLLDFSAYSSINHYDFNVTVSYQLDQVPDIANESAFSGMIGFSARGESNPTVVFSITKVDLHDTAVHQLKVTPEQSAKISSSLKRDKLIKIYLIGDVTKPPTHLSMNVSIEISYLPRPLKIF
jgi:hypothetical protein